MAELKKNKQPMIKNVLTLCICLMLAMAAAAQNITYSTVHSGENSREADVQVLGKIGANYMVFKSIGWKNMIQVFDQNMKELKNERLKFVPEKITNVDFVPYPNHVQMIYQYQRGSVLYCYAVKLDAMGNQQGEIVTLDTIRIGMRSAQGIYTTVYSEDKSHILVYKMFERNDKLQLVAKTYNKDLVLTDSCRSIHNFNDRKEVYSDFQIANSGQVLFTKQIKSGARENINQLQLIRLQSKTGEFLETPINLQEKYIDEVNMKIDNLNNNIILNTFYYPQKRSADIDGIFSAIINLQSNEIKTAVNTFSDSLRAKMGNSGSLRQAFNSLFLKNIFLKKDGSYILVAEDFFTETMGGFNRWNRWDYLYNNPYSYYDYNYLYSPYYRYNRFNSFNNRTSTKYYYNEILTVHFNQALQLTWQNVILKKQSEVDDDSYLSFGTFNAGGEIHFLFIELEKNSQIISNHSISPYGNTFRYPTLKSREAGYQFMPRLAKQVGARSVMMPCVKNNRICFARIDF